MANYNLTMTKTKLTVNCAGKTMEEDLVITGPTPIEEIATTEELDMADGNMVITPNEGQAFSSVTINKPDTMLPENIKKDINIGGVVGTLESGGGGASWEDTSSEDFLTVSYIGSYSYLTKNKKYMYLGSSDSLKSGLLCVDFENNTTTQLLTSGYYNNFFEDSNGNVYCGSTNSSSRGLYLLNGTTITTILSDSYYFKFYESNNGNVYVQVSYGEGGLYLLNGSNYTLVLSNINNYSWYFYFEDSTGSIYLSASSSSYLGLYKVKGSTSYQLKSEGYGYRYFYEASDGYVYFSSSDSSTGKGIYKVALSSTYVTQIYTEYYSYEPFYESSNGTLYVCGSVATSAGLYKIDGNNVTEIYSKGRYWEHFSEDSNGYIYLTENYASEDDLLVIDGATVTTLFSDDEVVGYRYKFTNSSGEEFISKVENPTIGDLVIMLKGTESYIAIYKG